MKKMLVVVLLLESVRGFSQDCGNYYFLQNNKTVEIAITNKKGKESGKSVYAISNVTKKGSVTAANCFDKMIW